MVVNFKKIPEPEKLFYSKRTIVIVDEDLVGYTNEEPDNIEGEIIGVEWCG